MTKETENTAMEGASRTPNRDKFNARMKKRYPDRTFADDEEMFGQIEDDYTTAEENENLINGLNEMIEKNDKAATMLSDMYKGKDPLMSLIENYGEEFVNGLTLEENKEKVAEASKKYLEKIAKSKELDEQIAKNEEQSMPILQAMRDKYGNEAVDACITSLGKKLKNWLLHIVTEEDIENEMKSLNYDADVATAAEDGEVKGRNANIQAKRRKATMSDGIPSARGGANKVMPRREGKDYGALSRTANAPSIWDRQ